MAGALRLGLVVLLGLCYAAPTLGQVSSLKAAAEAYLRPAVRDRVVSADTLNQFRTELRPNGRVDLDEGILRAAFNVQADVAGHLRPEAAARAYLSKESARFGLTESLDDLVTSPVRRGHASFHVSLRQVYGGIPVYNRTIKVNLDAAGRPTMVINGAAPHLMRASGLSTTPSISQEAAASSVEAFGQDDLMTTTPELVVYPSTPPRLAWRMLAWPDRGLVTWDVLVDAHSGDIIHMIDLSPHAHRPASAGAFARKASAKRAPSSAPGSMMVVDGTGLVFDPDPLTTSGASYGGPYVDGADSDTPELNAERKEVTLRDISQGDDGLYRLTGPYVIIDDGTRGEPYTPPAEASPDAFRYSRANDFFEAVNAYYHIDKSQRYVQSLNLGFEVRNEPIHVNPKAYPDDNSEFLRGAPDVIVFGTGGIDDAEDADVIWHEYAHALRHDIEPALRSQFEGSALDEGWADYWAASYSRHLSEVDPDVPSHDWRRIFNWDGNVGCWQGRSLDHPGHYPDDTSYPRDGCRPFGPQYEYGLLWATTLMEIYDVIGRPVLDRLSLASFAYLSSSTTFPDAAQAIIQADADLYGGIHTPILLDRFGARGYVDPAALGPRLTHQPVQSSEDLGGAVRIEVEAVGTTAAVDSVFVHYRADSGVFNRVVLTAQGGDTYAGQMPRPSQPGSVYYYVEAVDADGRMRRLPAGAPVDTYALQVGRDTQPPTIAHEAPLNVSVIGWPMDLFVDVQDNLGVDSVWVKYDIRSDLGDVQIEGAFGLDEVDLGYFGTFPASGHKVREDEAVRYRIFARDMSLAGNVAVSPSEGSYHVSIVEQGVLRAYDFEGLGQGLHGSGLWARGRPEFGLRVAHSGERVWATNLAGAYPDYAQTSSLVLPPVDLSGIGRSYLIFWHWYDFEHQGRVVPGESDAGAAVLDGGNVKISTDGGRTWVVAEPEDGYSGNVSEQHGNPLGGQGAFGGYSYGWRRSIVSLPEASDVRIRFEFGTDARNSSEAVFFAGWYLDDVTLTTAYPEDDVPPVATKLPAERTVVVPGTEAALDVEIGVADDTGIEAVLSMYEVKTAGGTEAGSTRLSMAVSDRNVYEGPVGPTRAFAPGDRVTFRLQLTDFAGNVTAYPDDGEAFVLDFRSIQESDALLGAVSTGAWRRRGGGWAANAATNSGEVSSLVLQPFTLPANSEAASLELVHRYDFAERSGGNVKLSIDDGRSWTVLPPESGYPASLSSDEARPMHGEGVFTGSSDGAAANMFDLSAHAGRTIRLRLDAASTAGANGWVVQKATYGAVSADEQFETPYTLDLQANFPDPFQGSTTVSYSIPDRSPVRISIFDMLGRRVAVVRHVEQDAGNYTLRFDASGLASGVYMLYLETMAGTRTERMVVAR